MTSAAPEKQEADRFERDVMEFADQIRDFIRRRVFHPQDAEDLAQEVLLKTFRSREALRDPGRLRAWVYKTARRTIADYFRKRKPDAPLPDELAGDTAFPAEAGIRLHAGIKRFVMALEPIYREPMLRAVFAGESVRTIARDLGLTESAVKSRLARGRARLRKRLFECCHFDFDTYGKVIDLKRRGPCACEAECDGNQFDPVRQNIEIDLASEDDAGAILALLRSANLTTADLTADGMVNFAVARREGRVIGAAGIEPLGRVGLLRSVVVEQASRRTGVGGRLVAKVEELAGMLGIRKLFLLTTTAAIWFRQRGYDIVDRSDAPAPVRQSRQFEALCPTSAVLMSRDIGVRKSR